MPFIDLHQDFACASFHDETRDQTDAAQLETANAKIVFGTGFTLPEENLADVMDRDIRFYEKLCADNPQWRMIRTSEDLEKINSDPRSRGILLHIEGMPGFTGEWDLLDTWFTQGLRSIAPVWNDDTFLGGGTLSSNGLTSLGREFLEYCESKGIMIDLAHANPQMFDDCMSALSGTPYISHGGLASIVPHVRNYSDDQIRRLVEKGGVMGVYFSRSTMSLPSTTHTLEAVAQHIKQAVHTAGEGSVCIGSDFGGIISGTPEQLASVSKITRLWDALASVGLSSTQIENISYNNAYQFLSRSLKLIA